MKFICFIFSFYVLALTLAPCIDCDGDDKLVTSAHKHVDCKDDGDDACSPFSLCSCVGCSGFTFSVPQLVNIPVAASTESYSTTYQSQFQTSFRSKIWQPPKIS